jgi:hypothetical protein
MASELVDPRREGAASRIMVTQRVVLDDCQRALFELASIKVAA